MNRCAVRRVAASWLQALYLWAVESSASVENERSVTLEHLEVERVMVREQHDRIGLDELLLREIDELDIERQRLAHMRVGSTHHCTHRHELPRHLDAGRLASIAGVLLVGE